MSCLLRITMVSVLYAAPSACGESGDTPQADSGSGDGAPLDADTDGTGAGTTRIAGTLDGQSFILTHAVVIFDDPLSTLCVSNAPITSPTCGLDDDVSKTVFFGKFGFDGGNPVWAFPQVEIRRIPAGGVELSTEGTLVLDVFDAAAEHAAGSLDVVFDSGSTQGTFAVP